MSAHQQLRAATGPDHHAVDAAFARFDLADRAGYSGFLEAHARAVPAIEAVLARADGPPPLRPRAPLLHADLTALGHAVPSPATIDPPASPAEAWGMAYVLEGSRLGGGLLARGVPADLPHAYLSDIHLPANGEASPTRSTRRSATIGHAPPRSRRRGAFSRYMRKRSTVRSERPDKRRERRTSITGFRSAGPYRPIPRPSPTR